MKEGACQFFPLNEPHRILLSILVASSCLTQTTATSSGNKSKVCNEFIVQSSYNMKIEKWSIVVFQLNIYVIWSVVA